MIDELLKSELVAEVKRCHARLEIDYEWRVDSHGLEYRVHIPYHERINQVDGIEARDATIQVLEEQYQKLKEAYDYLQYRMEGLEK